MVRLTFLMERVNIIILVVYIFPERNPLGRKHPVCLNLTCKNGIYENTAEFINFPVRIRDI